MIGLVWLKNTELLVIHGEKDSPDALGQDNKYHIVRCNKTWSECEFDSSPWDPLPTAVDPPPRPFPTRISASRLQNWAPDLDDMLIVTSSHTDSIAVFACSDKPLSTNHRGDDLSRWIIANPEDSRKAAVPRLVYGEEGDSVFIGEGLDLSATEKILRPIPALEELTEAPWPLPAYMALTHQGVLTAWWVVWNKSVEQGTRYPGLIAGSEESKPATSTTSTLPQSPAPNPPKAESTTPANQAIPSGSSNLFAKPAATFGSPSIPQFGATGLGSTPPFIAKQAQPSFGSSGFGSSTPAASKAATPAFGAPAFGTPSAISAPKTTGFGAVGGLGNKQSPWAASAQSQPSPFATATSGAGGFSTGGSGGFATSTSGGFASYGKTGPGSTLSSFGSNTSAQSGFAGLSRNQQGATQPGLKTEPSMGSTITIGSGTGSTLPSWANTPAQGGSIFGQSKSSFNTASFESTSSSIGDAENRKRDEATPTPQAPPQPAKGLFGLDGGFKLGTTFTGDGSSKEDGAKPTAPSTGSLFGSDFASGLGGASVRSPTTPAKEMGKEQSQEVSTTPASPPRQQKSLFSNTPSIKESATPKAPPPVEKAVESNDAPLPPDFLTFKPSKAADDDLPPLAGSPGVKVEAPSSSPEASPLDDEDGDDEDFSVEEDDEEEGEEPEEPSPSNAIRKPEIAKGWNFQDSVNQSPRVFPPAPTPPAAKAGVPAAAGRSTSPVRPALFGQPAKPAQNTPLFGQPSNTAFSVGFGNKPDQSTTPAKPFFPPPTNRPQAALRSPSPVRSASTSALRARRDPVAAPGSSLGTSIQQSKPPTPQPEAVDLEDEEDERMRARLASPIEPSRTLDEFTAYQNYAGKSQNKTGHAAQIEAIYKDINGMIDALGWNARSIKSFTQYHDQPQPGHKVNRETLEDAQNDDQHGSWSNQWNIGEIEGLKAYEDDLERELDAGRVQDVLDKLGQLARLLREKAKLMTRLNDIRRQIINRKDPDKVEASRKAPLTKEAADSQKNLRIEYARLLTLLSQAEEAAVLLRSRIASHNAQQGKAGAMPTVDAVKKTIIKMTALAEKRNNDITLMESQLRKCGLADSNRPSSSSSRTPGTPHRSRGTSLRNSMAESPFATPPTSRNKMSLSELNRRALTPEADLTPTGSKGYGLYYTPEGSPTPGNELARLSDLVDENIDSLRETAKRRKQVAAGLKKALIDRGVKTTKTH